MWDECALFCVVFCEERLFREVCSQSLLMRGKDSLIHSTEFEYVQSLSMISSKFERNRRLESILFNNVDSRRYN